MTIAEVICWIFVFATLLSLFIHQRMITKLLTFYSDYYGNAMINSIFRVERLLQDKRGVILYTFEKDGVKYEILERKVEKKIMSEEQDWKAVQAIYDDIEERWAKATTSKECADLIEETKNAPPWFDKIWFVAGIGSKMRELKEMEDKNGHSRGLSGEGEKNE